jgi:hypothetical protein
LSRVSVTLDWVLDWMIGFIAPYTFTTRDYGQYSAISNLHTLQSTVTHAVGFAVFISRILATDLLHFLCNFRSHMKSSAQSTSFLAVILQLQIPKTRLNSIPLLQSSYPGRLASRNSTLHCGLLLCYIAEHFFITTLHGPRRKQLLLLMRCVYWSVT